ncbi:nucleoid occlusion factor SlmA [Halieaceae bacterium IMCC14734]|uniref:Nucleoid occlusion factor SlmA n=1 Tax=Candidatus Litorirhabdus singularis TaxID=2518993 RepID=A0ABT3TCI9_9GAMM|nr:nucleoid occlusion factor SlmA [Candidatus Litorirhabdus singularis]MCX2980020.1 nucleoid occlusion factor SlmA [Candidatus Litorirhabdus singularis]
MSPRKSQRRQQILEALAQMLEASPGERITTAKLAAQVGVSEAALYRHFPSKSKMFEGLIEFIEETLFSRIKVILAEDPHALSRCEKMLGLLLGFTERNPGITRILTGDALAGETERLHARVAQLFDRFEAQLKQVLREAEIREGLRPRLPVNSAATLLLAAAEGRISQFVRSGFQRPPTENWPEQWQQLSHDFFKQTPVAANPNQAGYSG